MPDDYDATKTEKIVYLIIMTILIIAYGVYSVR